MGLGHGGGGRRNDTPDEFFLLLYYGSFIKSLLTPQSSRMQFAIMYCKLKPFFKFIFRHFYIFFEPVYSMTYLFVLCYFCTEFYLLNCRVQKKILMLILKKNLSKIPFINKTGLFWNRFISINLYYHISLQQSTE